MLARWEYKAPNIWREMSRLSREMDRYFGEGKSASRAGVFPPLNLYDDGECLVVRAEVPGIDSQNLDIDVTVNALTVKGERKRADVEADASYHRRERGSGTFSRAINLPQEVDPDKVQANYNLGVLEIILPKAEEAKPRKIKVLN